MPQVPYTGAPTVAPTTNAGSDYINVQANPAAFGAANGQGAQGLAGGLEQLSQHAAAYQGMQEETRAKDADIALSEKLADIQFNPKTGYQTLQGKNAVDAYDGVRDAAHQAYQDIRSTLSPMAAQMFDASAVRRVSYALDSMASYAATQNKAWQNQTAEARITNEVNQGALYWNDPNKFQQSLGTIASEVDALAEQQGASPEAKQAMLTHYQSEAWTARIRSVLKSDPNQAATMLDQAGDGIDAAHRSALQSQIVQGQQLAESRGLIQQQRALMLEERQRRVVGEQAGNEYVTQMLTDPTKVDLTQLANDDRLSYEQKLHLTAAAQGVLKKQDGNDAAPYGPGFIKAFQAVHAPDGDPNKIVDPSTLYSRMGEGGDLTVAGVEKLTQEIQSRRTPDGEAEAELKRQFFKVAQGEITGTNDGLHIRDPKGDQLYLKFMVQALPAYEQGKKAGKTPAQMLNPDSPDYIGKSITTFKRSPAQWASDLTSGGVSSSPDLTNQKGIVDAYRAGSITREQAAQALAKGGFARLGSGPQVPTDE